jgi:hypothetical protein
MGRPGYRRKEDSMSATTDARHTLIASALTDTQGKSVAEQAAAVDAALVPQPTQDVANTLWTVVVVALAVIAIGALAGIIGLILAGKSADLVLTAFTASVTGLLGLFVQSPVQSGK